MSPEVHRSVSARISETTGKMRRDAPGQYLTIMSWLKTRKMNEVNIPQLVHVTTDDTYFNPETPAVHIVSLDECSDDFYLTPQGIVQYARGKIGLLQI